MSRRFLLFAAKPHLHSLKFHCGGLGQTWLYTQQTRRFADGYHPKRRCRPIQQNQWLISQRRLGTHRCLQKKIGNKNGTERHEPVQRARWSTQTQPGICLLSSKTSAAGNASASHDSSSLICLSELN